MLMVVAFSKNDEIESSHIYIYIGNNLYVML